MDIQTMPLADLNPAKYNPRKDLRPGDPEYEKLKRSIQEFGVVDPLVWNKRTGNLVGGHQRYKVMREMGMVETAVSVVDLDDQREKALNLALNKISGEWDMPKLADVLKELDAADFDMDLTGFDMPELDDIFGGSDTNTVKEDEVPEPPKEPVTKPGDLWILGKHRLLCGDSTKKDDVERLMGGEKAQLLHADPPYGMGKESEGIANDNLYRDKLDAFQMKWWQAFRPSMEDIASAYIWGNAADLWRLWYRGGLADSERLTMRNEIVWDKGGGGHGVGTKAQRCYYPTERCLFFMLGEQGFNNNSDNYWNGWEPIRAALKAECDAMGWKPKDIERICGVGMYSHWFNRSQWEFIPHEHYKKLQTAARGHDAFKREYDELKQEFYATRAYFDNAHDNMTDVWTFPRVAGEERCGHATPKPVAMMARVMKSSLPNGGLCVEPFGGSGSTLIAAEQTERLCYTMEIEPRYCDVIVKRWETLTGEKARLA